MGKFRDYLNEARAMSVPTEYRIALGQLKRMYNPGEVPSEKELQKDVEMIAKKNHLEADKFLEFVKSQFKLNEATMKFKVGDKVWKVVFKKGKYFPEERVIWKVNSAKNFYSLETLDGYNTGNYPAEYIYASQAEAKKGKFFDVSDIDWNNPKDPYYYLCESAVGKPGRTTEKDAEEHINDELIAEFKKIIKKLGGKTVAKVLLDKLSQKAEIKDEIEHIEDLIDNSNY